ncbi:MAG TPA: TetR/AcrR family transcriptional regulator [Acidimicrobiales bacterium]|nr:TetR/AcrR family transcriptional regulator [Acidimicrobiales bacterium]
MTEIGLRERKKQETRRSLVLAALALVDERGLDAVTIDEIAAAAGVSTRTFFNHFDSKEDAVLGVPSEVMAEMHERLAARPADEAPLAALREAFLEVADMFERDPKEWSCRMALVDAEPVLLDRLAGAFARFERSLRAVVADRLGVDLDDGYPELVVASAMVAARVAMQRWQADQGTRPFREVLHDTFAVLEHGLVPPPVSPRSAR